MNRVYRVACLMLVVIGVGCSAERADGPGPGRAQADPAAPPFDPPMDHLYENRLQVESAEYLSINLFNVPIDPQKAADPQRFTVTSPDDPAYAVVRAVHPLASGSRTRTIRAAQRKDLLVKGTHIFLKLPAAMTNGKTYAVTVGDIGAADPPALLPVPFDDRRQVNDNLRVNQLGHLPGYAKYAYLGQYMGDLGHMLFSARTFELVNSAGTSVFTGPVKRRGVRDELVGQAVYELDFSPVDAPGTYRLRVPGVGLSHPFQIGPKALNPALVNLMRGHFHQRCGQAIDAAFSRHARDACHLDDAWLAKRVEALSFVAPKRPPLYPTAYDAKQHPAVRGHHDAGDYGKYTITGAAYVFSACVAFEAFPDKFRDDNLGLPTSGNGIPDLLEECKWELDWLENMQDPADGGVFGVIRPNTGGYENHLPPAQAGRLFFPKDTVFTGAYAAALAHASRSPLMRRHYPKDCDRYLAKAQQAWQFLATNDRYVEYFHYGAIFGDADERAWAAMELYAATGEDKYHRHFLAKFDPAERRWGWWGMVEGVGNAAVGYVFLNDRPKDPAMLARCQQALRDACATHLRESAAHPYRLSMPQASINHKSYGWYFPGDLSGWDLLMGYALDKDKRYLQCALDNLGYECGANPSGYFLQTGLGAKRNIEVVSEYANHDDVVEPVPGLPLGIGSAGFYWLDRYGQRLAEGTYPAEWPLMNRWYDGFNVQTEFTMGPMMRETLVAAYFANLGGVRNERPTVKITADRRAGTAPLTVHFDLDATGARGALAGDAVRQVFWDFGDESFSAARAPAHTFADAGRQYPVAVTVFDQDGLWGFDTVTINCVRDGAPYPQTERTADKDTVVLFHLNGDLKDGTDAALELKVETKMGERRPYRFVADPMWMAEPRGQCLALDGAEHFIVTLPPDAVPSPATTPLTLEMMLYLREFAGWGYPGNPLLLGLQNDWDSHLAWGQETWDKSAAPRFGSAIPPERFLKEFPRNRWCHVKVVYDGRGESRFVVDGRVWGSLPGQPFKASVKKPLTLSFGPFRGMVDEVRVRTGAD